MEWNLFLLCGCIKKIGIWSVSLISKLLGKITPLSGLFELWEIRYINMQWDQNISWSLERHVKICIWRFVHCTFFDYKSCVFEYWSLYYLILLGGLFFHGLKALTGRLYWTDVLFVAVFRSATIWCHCRAGLFNLVQQAPPFFFFFNQKM